MESPSLNSPRNLPFLIIDAVDVRVEPNFAPPNVEGRGSSDRCGESTLWSGYFLYFRALYVNGRESLSRNMFWVFFFGFFGLGSRVTLITSASPLGLAVKYITFESGLPCVRSIVVSRNASHIEPFVIVISLFSVAVYHIINRTFVVCLNTCT